ncbi:MAG: hypothetical protein GW754_03670 [Candidatus Pacebacteria bacterium]|nr:hypothetical protein [Candidatus Paceibacterota bacterium]
MSQKKKLENVEDIAEFERSLVKHFWKKIKDGMPVTVEDSRQTDSADEAAREQRISFQAFQELHGFNPNDKEEVLNQYRQGNIKQAKYPLPTVIFPQSSKAPLGVNYLNVRVTAQQTSGSSGTRTHDTLLKRQVL